uniref:Uncharacterized protein n=1 Tax=Glossina morsitans morsitans TaxID=37546 RepID=A0A1B0G188_GLOMM
MDELPATAEAHNLPVNSFQADDLLEKLKLLNYEKNLLSELKMKPISRFYFLKSTNPGEQFYMFTLIAWWLLEKLGKHTMAKPQESDDPNDVIAKIVLLLQEMDVPVDFTPNRLIRGAGASCIFVLDTLATQALKVIKFSCQKPHITQEEDVINDYMEDNAEIILEKIEDEQNGIMSDDSGEFDVNGYNFRQWQNQTIRTTDKNLNSLEISDKLTDQQFWRLEFEQVLPQLKVFVKSDIRDWRAHLAQMESFKKNIDEITEDTQLELKKLYNEFTYILEKVESREKHLNNELQQLIQQYKEISIELSHVQHGHTQMLAQTEHSVEQLKAVIAENDNKKTEMERRGQMMSDSSFVIQIKKAVAKLKDDVAHLNLEVALLVSGIDREIVRKITNTMETSRDY